KLKRNRNPLKKGNGPVCHSVHPSPMLGFRASRHGGITVQITRSSLAQPIASSIGFTKQPCQLLAGCHFLDDQRSVKACDLGPQSGRHSECANRPKAERPMPTVPLFDAHQPASLLPAFKESLQRMGGRPGTPPA